MLHVSTDTQVTFPRNSTVERSKILWVNTRDLTDGAAGMVVAETTPFHPLDHTWPDQPGDTGVIDVDGRVFQVTDSVTAAVSPEGTVFLGDRIPVRRGEAGWAFVVGHVVQEGEGVELAELVGEEAVLRVDADRRKALSAAHTSCHAMSLALNRAVSDLWRKEVATDSLGSPNFDQLAIQESRITTECSLDRYRLGKSLRKRGLDVAALLADVDGIAAKVNETLGEWLATPSPIHVEAPTGKLGEIRTWHCSLSTGDAHLPCGGTHLQDLQELSAITVTIDTFLDQAECVVKTVPVLA